METIRLCEISEIPKLQEFIHNFWKEDHVLSKNEELLRFQHQRKPSDKMNFVVAYDEEKHIFTAILGFIPTWQYDGDILGNDIWLAIWKRSPIASKGIGMKLYEFLVESHQPRSISAIGINDEIKKRYKEMGFKTGVLAHYYLLKQDTKIASIPHSAEKPNVHIKEIETFNDYIFKEDQYKEFIPKKSAKYFKQRYKNHPTYKYIFFGLYDADDSLLDVMVVRKNFAEGTSCLRIVDVYRHFEHITYPIHTQLQNILHKENSEYIDILNLGIDGDQMNFLGFNFKFGEIIIPNYFEPFENRNISTEYAYKIFSEPTSESDYMIYKGDSDRDRPNI